MTLLSAVTPLQWEILILGMLTLTAYTVAIGPLRRRIVRSRRKQGSPLPSSESSQPTPLVDAHFWRRMSNVAFIAPVATLVICILRSEAFGDTLYWTIATFVFVSLAFNTCFWATGLCKMWLRRRSRTRAS